MARWDLVTTQQRPTAMLVSGSCTDGGHMKQLRIRCGSQYVHANSNENDLALAYLFYKNLGFTVVQLRAFDIHCCQSFAPPYDKHGVGSGDPAHTSPQASTTHRELL